MLTKETRLSNGFEIGKLMDVLDVDFIYSYDAKSNKYLLLNQSMWGDIDPSIVDAQKQDNKIVIVTLGNLSTQVYNIEPKKFDEAIAFVQINSK